MLSEYFYFGATRKTLWFFKRKIIISKSSFSTGTAPPAGRTYRAGSSRALLPSLSATLLGTMSHWIVLHVVPGQATLVVQCYVEAATQSKQPPKVGRHPPVEKHWSTGRVVFSFSFVCATSFLHPPTHPPTTCSSAPSLSSSTCSSAPSQAFSKAFALMQRQVQVLPLPVFLCAGRGRDETRRLM